MGVPDYLCDDNDRWFQVKCFGRAAQTYRTGYEVPLPGTYSIVLREGGYANIQDGVLVKFTNNYPMFDKQIDKWGRPYEPEAYGAHDPFAVKNLLGEMEHPSL